MAHQVHEFGISCHFLLISRFELLDSQVRQQSFDFPVRKPAAFNAGGRADALNGRHSSQGQQPAWRKRAQGTPCTFEFVDPGNQTQDLWRDLKGVGSKHEPIIHPFPPILTMQNE